MELFYIILVSSSLAITSDEPEPSWLEPQLELKYFQLGSARLVTILLQLGLFFSARKSENCHFLLSREKKLILKKLHTKKLFSTMKKGDF
jgi:hypothetical protein